jgi:hypothetical protein
MAARGGLKVGRTAFLTVSRTDALFPGYAETTAYHRLAAAGPPPPHGALAIGTRIPSLIDRLLFGPTAARASAR